MTKEPLFHEEEDYDPDNPWPGDPDAPRGKMQMEDFQIGEIETTIENLFEELHIRKRFTTAQLLLGRLQRLHEVWLRIREKEHAA